MEHTVKVVFEKKQGKEFIPTWETTDEKQIYDDLSHELISKKINNCSWIGSIKRTPLYDGYQKIIVTYDHGGRRIYTVTSH